MNLVEITKLRASPQASVPPGDWSNYPVGRATAASSLPVQYTIVGWLMQAPRIGNFVKVLRLSRNGLERLGLFTSTAVVDVTEDGFVTVNSVYRLRYLPTAS